MKEIIISKNDDGIRLSKYLKKIFSTMPDNLLHKLLRKKYFEINYKKAEGSEILKANDTLSIFLADDTFDKFFYKNNITDNISNEILNHCRVKKDNESENECKDKSGNNEVDYNEIKERIVYEDNHIIVYNKPAGMLSQGDKSGDVSVNDLLNYYLNHKLIDINDSVNKDDIVNDGINIENIETFKASIVNRLDRNTEGLIIFSKTYIAAREISSIIKRSEIEKHYMTIVNGVVKKDEDTLVNIYKKDEKNNKAIIKEYSSNKKVLDGYSIVKLKYKVIERKKDNTILDIDLITGKSHQIRAQLAYIGHPIICDKKYMDEKLYRGNVKEYGLKSQKLMCYKIKFPKFVSESLKYLSNKLIEIKFEGI